MLLVACKPHGDTHSQRLLDRAEALKISRVAALAKGYDLERYQLQTFGQELSQDKEEWLFGYAQNPSPPPGGMFLVVVDRRTGKAEVYPGE